MFGMIVFKYCELRSRYFVFTCPLSSGLASTESADSAASNSFLVITKNDSVSYFCFRYIFSLPCSYCVFSVSTSICQALRLSFCAESARRLRIRLSALSKFFPLFI